MIELRIWCALVPRPPVMMRTRIYRFRNRRGLHTYRVVKFNWIEILRLNLCSLFLLVMYRLGMRFVVYQLLFGLIALIHEE